MDKYSGSFSIMHLSPVEEAQGCLLTLSNLAVLQNLKAAAAEEALQVLSTFKDEKFRNEEFINSRLRAAYLSGQIDMIKLIQQRHEAISADSHTTTTEGIS